MKLRCIDIITEVSALSSHLALPCKGHLEAVFHVFAYLEHWHNAQIVYDPNYPNVDLTVFKQCNWKEFYGHVEEALPLNAPEPRGCDIDLCMFVDSDHAGDKLMQHSRTGFIIYLNSAPIVWYLKKQATIETSVFGAEFHGYETRDGSPMRSMLQTPYDGCQNFWTLIHLR